MKIPQDTTAEKELLSYIVFRDGSIVYDLDSLQPEHFFVPEHQEIYGSIKELERSGTDINATSIRDQVEKGGGLHDSIIASLSEVLSTSAMAKYAAQKVVTCYKKRVLQEVTYNASQSISNGAEDVNDVVDSLTKTLVDMQGGATNKNVDIKSLSEDYVEYLRENKERIENSDGGIIGLPTGIPELDKMIDGLQDASLYVVAAMTSGGKSAHMINMVSAITNINKKVSVYSLEMTPNGIINRLIGLRTGFDASLIKRMELESDEKKEVKSQIDRLAGQGIKIYDSEFSDIDRIISSIVSDVYRGDTDCVFIDYIQMINHKDSREERQKLEYAVTALRTMVNRLRVPVVILTQLNNETVDNPNKESHGFQGSGAIAQRATAAWTLKPEVQKNVRKEMHKSGLPLPVRIEFNKHQEGAVSYCLASFMGKTGKFESVTADEFEKLKQAGQELMGEFNFDDD